MAGKTRTHRTHKGEKPYVRRDPEGRFSESDDVGRCLATNRRTKAETKV